MSECQYTSPLFDIAILMKMIMRSQAYYYTTLQGNTTV